MTDDEMRALGGLFSAMEMRDAGISRVSENNSDWMADALDLLAALDLEDGTGEDFRLWLTQRGLGDPSHPNAWGACMMMARKRGLIVPTDRYRASRCTPSHARKLMVYRAGKGEAA